MEKLVKSGSYLVLPDDASIRADAEEMKVIRPGTPAAAQMIAVKDMEGNISQDLTYLQQVYEEARTWKRPGWQNGASLNHCVFLLNFHKE